MKPKFRIIISINFLLILFFVQTPTFGADHIQPNEEQINSAVIRVLKKEIPVSWVGNLMGGQLVKLDELQVARIGIYNEDKKYWPMKIRCIGIAEPKDPFNKGKMVQFDKIGDFLFYIDDYGDWQAIMRGSIFQ